MRYIELNPVRAGMVKGPIEYRFSSFHSNGQGGNDKLLTPNPVYIALGQTLNERCEAYRGLFKAHVDADTLALIRSAWQTGTPLGNEYFKSKIEHKLKCKVGYEHRGRPKKIMVR
jgi:putative transposase